jgi:flagellar biosynthesis chaperone FliJ
MPLLHDNALKRETNLRLPVRRSGAVFGRGAISSLAITLALLLLATSILLVPSARAVTYKWVDDQGTVHYTDKIPPEAINKGSIELNKQGVPIKKTDPALSPEQRRAREAEDERTRQAAKIRDEIQRKDRALLQTYTTESEIDLSKKRALGTIDGQIQSAQGYIATLNKRKEEIATRVAALGGKPTPAALEREITNVDEELDKQADLIAVKRKEMVAVTARYDADKQRWRELRTMAESGSAGTSSTGKAVSADSSSVAIPTGTKK